MGTEDGDGKWGQKVVGGTNCHYLMCIDHILKTARKKKEKFKENK